MRSLLSLLVCVFGLPGTGKATLEIRQGRITDDSGPVEVELIQVVGIATVELGGLAASRPTYFFDCITSVSMNNGFGIRWTRMGTPDQHRFDVEDIPGGSSIGRRMKVGGISYDDLGVYVCSDSANDDSVSVNITGSNPAIMAVKKRVKVVQDESVALEVYVSGYPIPQITWYYPNHSAIMGSTEGGVKFRKDRKKLILSDVDPEQAGQYSCQVEVSLDPYRRAKEEIQLQVFAKPTIHAFSADPIKQEADFEYSVPLSYVGTILECEIDLVGWTTPDLDIEWKKDGFVLHRESGIISEYTTEEATSNSDTSTSVLAELIWTREFRNSDEGVYECIVQQRNISLRAVSQRIELKAVTMTTTTVIDHPWTMCGTSINQQVMYFQIRIIGVDCRNWMESQKEHIATQVHQDLLLAVEYECNCAVDDRELKLVGAPQCSVQIEDAAVFRWIIQTNSLEKTRLIFCALSFWLEESAQLQIDDQFQAIDSSCPMEASESLSEECVPPVEIVIPSDNNNTKEIVAIVGGMGGFVMIVILLITLVCCIGCYRYPRKFFNINGKCDGGVHDTKEVSQGDHTYDHIDFHSRYSSNTLNNGERAQATVSIEFGAESPYAYGQLQPSKTTYSEDATQGDTEDQIYERISNLDLQLESEDAQPYSEPEKIYYTIAA